MKMIIHGQDVDVQVCKPSRRKAASNIQKPRFNRKPQQGARFIAKDNGQIEGKE